MVSKPALRPDLQITEPESKHQTRYVSFSVWGGGGGGGGWGGEVKFVQAWWVQRGGLSLTRWTMKGQRWHSLAQEWKTFFVWKQRSYNRRRCSAERGRGLACTSFGEIAHLEVQRRPPEPGEGLCSFGNGDNTVSPSIVRLENNTA